MRPEFWLLLGLTVGLVPARRGGSARWSDGSALSDDSEGTAAAHRAVETESVRTGRWGGRGGLGPRHGDRRAAGAAGAARGTGVAGSGATAAPAVAAARLGPIAGIAAAVTVLVLSPSLPGLIGATAALVALPLLVPRLTARDRAPALVDPASPFLADLIAAVLRSGAPLSTALRQVAAAQATATPLAVELAHVGGLLALGAEPEQAWARVAADGELGELARVACRSNESGIRLAESFERVAGQLRSRAAASAKMRAERVGVWAVAPLGLCFLPAFLCLGIAPVVIGIGRVIFASVNP